MIRPGDRVMVCLSGGKDSLTLLHTLHQYQHYATQRAVFLAKRRANQTGDQVEPREVLAQMSQQPYFSLAACTIDPGSSGYDPRPLKPYLQSLGVPYFYEEQDIMQAAQQLPHEVSSICSFCSRMKRGALYTAARREGFNVLAMGQHLDDLTESFLMSIFHNGLLRTMKAHYVVEGEDLRVIRPFVFVREKLTRAFADKHSLPVIPENCPACFQGPTERYRVKALLAEQESQFPRLYFSLKAALLPLMSLRRDERLGGQTSSSLVQNSVDLDS